MKAAELFVKQLGEEGVTCLFGLPGEENLHFLEAVRKAGLKVVITRHEQAASFMAATLRETHGKSRGLFLDPWAGGHQFGHGNRACAAHRRAAHCHHGPEAEKGEPAGEIPVSGRNGPDETHHQKNVLDLRSQHHPHGDSRGLQNGRSRAARRRSPRIARGRRRGGCPRRGAKRRAKRAGPLRTPKPSPAPRP